MGIQLVTVGIILVNILFSFKGFKDSIFFNKYKFQISPIQQGDKLRMLTSGFLHVDQGHLILNMFTLFIFANYVIFPLSSLLFLLIYFGSLMAGSLMATMIHRNQPYYSAVGASGAVTGILYAAILLNPTMGNLYLFFAIPIPPFVFAIGYILYSIYGMKNSIGNIGHSAHLGGAIGGYVLAILLKPEILETNRFVIIALAIPIILLFILKDKFIKD